ncbi:MAG: caspase family protein, partial [Pseudomonadota bacterium]|nr:caspase family protein [Pseudomonadota bacterium]
MRGGDPERRLDDTFGLKQLSSPPVSAQAVAEWFLGRHAKPDAQHGYYNPKAPAASLEMLVSPPWVPSGNAQRYAFPFPEGRYVGVDGASRENIASCYVTWLQRVKANPQNVGVLYFCGHGVTGLNDYLLPEDFGHTRGNPWHDAIDIGTTARAARRSVAGALYFFIDACREMKYGSVEPGALPQALEPVKIKRPVLCFSRLMLWATGEGSMAHAAEGKPSRFSAALIQALSGYYGEPAPEGAGWVVTSSELAKGVEQIVEQENRELAAHLHQHIEVERIASQPFHYETRRPKKVGQTLSAEAALTHVRDVLVATPGAAMLPPGVQEVIAESVESGRIPLENIQQEVGRWSRDLSDWQERLATEHDREAAERALELVAAGKLDEAGALYDHLIEAAEARAVSEHARLASYYSKRANVLALQGKWQDSFRALENALANAENAFT